MVLMLLPESYTTHLETLMDVANSSRHTFTVYDFISKAIGLFDKWQLWVNCNPSPITGALLSTHSKLIKRGRAASMLHSVTLMGHCWQNLVSSKPIPSQFWVWAFTPTIHKWHLRIPKELLVQFPNLDIINAQPCFSFIVKSHPSQAGPWW